jgi:hypothetical protein
MCRESASNHGFKLIIGLVFTLGTTGSFNCTLSLSLSLSIYLSVSCHLILFVIYLINLIFNFFPICDDELLADAATTERVAEGIRKYTDCAVLALPIYALSQSIKRFVLSFMGTKFLP